MKKIVLSGIVIASFMLYSVTKRSQVAVPAPVDVLPPSVSTSSQSHFGDEITAGVDVLVTPAAALTPSETPSTMMSRPPATMPMQKMSGKFKDGSYVGSVADAIYGNIQVKATIQNGQLSDVVFLQYPNDRDRSIEINTFAMPILKREAIAAQSAEVDVVSGATDSSIAFTESLTSALSKAL